MSRYEHGAQSCVFVSAGAVFCLSLMSAEHRVPCSHLWSNIYHSKCLFMTNTQPAAQDQLCSDSLLLLEVPAPTVERKDNQAKTQNQIGNHRTVNVKTKVKTFNLDISVHKLKITYREVSSTEQKDKRKDRQQWNVCCPADRGDVFSRLLLCLTLSLKPQELIGVSVCASGISSLSQRMEGWRHISSKLWSFTSHRFPLFTSAVAFDHMFCLLFSLVSSSPLLVSAGCRVRGRGTPMSEF